jgi:RNA polymerase sigma-70 factor (family 1)
MARINIQEVLIRISRKDKRAFDEFFEYYYPRLLKFAVSFVKSYVNAEEVVSDVFIKLLKRRDTLKDIENFNGYIFHAVKNQSLTFIGRKKPDIYLNEDEEDYLIIDTSNPETQYLDQELLDQLKKSIDNLPPKRRMIYKLIKEDGLKYQEAADLLDVSVKTIEVHMGLAINNVREAIKAYLYDKGSSTTLKKLIPLISPLLISTILFVG